MAQGKGGRTLNDRVLAADVRTLSLGMIKKYLEGEDEDFKKQLILKLAGTALPRIQEITGQDGGAINVNLIKYGESPTATEEIKTEGSSI